MMWHQRLGHCPFRITRSLAAFGIPQKKILEARPPKCATCEFGGMIRQAWRRKASYRKDLKVARPHIFTRSPSYGRRRKKLLRQHL